MTTAFISYSRKDSVFARRLIEALKKNDLDIWVDWEDIPPSVEWMKEIEKGIEGSDVYVFLISPDSIVSQVNLYDVAHADKNGKRIIPIVVRATSPQNTPESIRRLNWIFMREDDDFEMGIQKVMFAINIDLEWAEEHRRIQVRALEWVQGNKDSSYLLRGRDLDNAEAQIAASSSKDPRPTTLQLEYISASRRGASILSRGVNFVSNAFGGGNQQTAVKPEPANDIPAAPVSQSASDVTEATPAEQKIEEPAKLSPEQIAEREAFLQAAIAANRLANNRSQAVLNDRSQGEDQLGIKDEVEALAETLLLRDVEPPVSVGVMGGWGSGKSFVMYLINQYVQATRAKNIKMGWAAGDEKDPKIPAFVGHIYQINFNAWTYAKSNLWASLMDTIFSSLNRQMQLERLLAYREFTPDKPPTKEQIYASMLAGGDEFKKIYQDNLRIDQDKDFDDQRKKNLAHWSHHLLKGTLLWNIMRGQQVETLEKLKDTEEQLNQLKTRREKFEKDRSLNEITAKDLDGTAKQTYFQSIKSFMLAFLSDQLSAVAKDELKKQDVSEADVQKYLDEAKGLWGGLKTVVTAFRRSKLYLIWTLIFFALTFALPVVWNTYDREPIQMQVAKITSGFLALLPTLTIIVPWIKKSIEASVEAKKILEGVYVAQQAKHAEEIANATDKPLPQKITELQTDISKGSLAAYDALIGLFEAQAEEQRQKIGPSAKYSNLMEFVQSRLDSATYENQLGLMHQVRQDIDELTYSLVDNASPDAFPRGKPRVILYIDDLDRCPPPRVVEMLEAVQLLLNTKLFIVILGLDTRYVTRALEKEYKEILQHEGDPSGLDYIEKIIQIPYRVRSIEADGLRKYIEKQMDIEKITEPTVTSNTPPVQAVVVQGAQPVTRDEPTSQTVPPQSVVDTPPTLSVNVQETISVKAGAAETKKEIVKPPEIELPAAVVQFKQEDLDDMAASCQKVMLTPRSIKRLVNVFKLMKIFWFRADKDAGIAERDRPRAVKQAAISLLALSSAYPEVMREVFVQLETMYRQGQEQTDLFTALNNIRLPAGSAHELFSQLKKYRADISALKAITGNGQAQFGQLTLQELNLSTFNIVRSFSFVGDPVFWTDEDEASAPPKNEKKASIPSKRNTKKKTDIK